MSAPDDEFRARLVLGLVAVGREANRRRERLRREQAAAWVAVNAVVLALPLAPRSLAWLAVPAVVLLAAWTSGRQGATNAWVDAYNVIHTAAGEPNITSANPEEDR